LAELLFWPALLLYGEAAVGYFGDARRPGAAGRVATWGVRLGWLVQTALLAVQAARENGFPWGTWGGLAQPLRVARRRGLSDLGLPRCLSAARSRRDADRSGAADRRPLQAAARRSARAATTRTSFSCCTSGSCSSRSRASRSQSALSALYLWQERRLKRRATTILRRPAPSLATLDRLAARTVAISLPPLTLGIAVGLARLIQDGDRLDAIVIATLVTWAAWVAYLILRVNGWSGRRAAYVALAGFALVILVRLALPVTHFA